MPTAFHRTARRLTGRLGVHGYGLVLIAIIWTLMGIGVYATPLRVNVESTLLIHLYIPAPIRASLWLVGAAMCAAVAIQRTMTARRRNVARRDGLALAVACAAPCVRVVSHLWSWIVSIVPGPPIGSPHGWLSAAIYASMVGIAWLVAAIPDDPDPDLDLTEPEAHTD